MTRFFFNFDYKISTRI